MLALVLALALQELKAGAATSNVTPPLGLPIVGNWNSPPAGHVHDELHARCLVLDDGKTRLAIVIVDNVGIARNVLDEARQLVAEETKLPPANLLMSSTHTHSACSARGEGELSDYSKFLARRIADGVRRAVRNLEPAKIAWEIGRAHV